METVIVLDRYTLTVMYDREHGTGTVDSNLHCPTSLDPEFDPELFLCRQAALLSIEQLVMAHVFAGVEVQAADYKAGLQAAIDGIKQLYSD
jgi:hypothetical protein